MSCIGKRPIWVISLCQKSSLCLLACILCSLKLSPDWIAVHFWHGAAARIPGQVVLIFTHNVLLLFKCLSRTVLRNGTCCVYFLHCINCFLSTNYTLYLRNVALYTSMFVCRIVYVHKPINCFNINMFGVCCVALLLWSIVSHFSNWFSLLHKVIVERFGLMSWTEGVGLRCRCKAKGIICPANKLALCSSLTGMCNRTVHYRRPFSFLPKLNCCPTFKSHWHHSGYLR